MAPRVPAPVQVPRSRRWRYGAAALAVLVILLLVGVAAFPWASLKGRVERRLSAKLGRPVTIASVERLDRFGFTPRLAVRGLVIPQPAWAGRGDFARLAEGRVTFSVWPLLFGRFRPRDMVLSGLRLALVRNADGTTNYGGSGGGGLGVSLAGLTVSDAVITYRDAERDRGAALRLSINPARGLALVGDGRILGHPVTLAMRGPAIAGDAPWPFVARIDGRALAMTARGTTDHPLDVDHMTIDVAARADDLRLIDAVIEAGLFGTQTVRMVAHGRRDFPDWRVTGLRGTIGISDVAGEVSTHKSAAGRHQITGRLVSRALRFDDFASTGGLEKAAAERARAGPRIVPNLMLNLAKLAHTDGRIDFRVGRVLDAGALRSMRGTVTLKDQVLVASPFRLDLTQGTVTGTGRVVQGGRPVPTISLDLFLAGASIPTLVGGHGTVTGTVSGHARVSGPGSTIREAVGNGDGRLGLVARGGVLPKKLADELGFDAGGTIFAKKGQEAALRCIVLPLTLRRGHGTVDPALVVDTGVSKLTGHGTIDFPSEAIDIVVTGAPNHHVLLRLPGSATIGGTIRDPKVTLAKGTKSFGNILKGIGRTITGRQGPPATPADCRALAAAALR